MGGAVTHMRVDRRSVIVWSAFTAAHIVSRHWLKSVSSWILMNTLDSPFLLRWKRFYFSPREFCFLVHL